MKRIRYRCEAGSSNRAEARFHNIHRLGRITEIRGYRFRSTRGGSNPATSQASGQYTATHERVMVKGINGTARFDGCCWGYNGSGPHALRHLLVLCGVSDQIAAKIAHESERLDALGTDWLIELGAPSVVRIVQTHKLNLAA